MTDQEMRETVAGLVISTAELRKAQEETRKAQEETRRTLQDLIEDREREREDERKAREEERKAREEERKAQERELNVWRKAQERELNVWREAREKERKAREQELNVWREAQEKILAKMAADHEKTERVVRRVSKQLGQLGNRMGGLVEGMALASMTRILNGEFGMPTVSPSATRHVGGETMEIDVLALGSVEENEAMIIEVKGHLASADIEQILTIIEKFPKFFPELASRKIYGALVGVNIPDNVRVEVLNNGLYLAGINDNVFEMQTPRDFKPKVFNINGRNGRKRK